MSVVARKKGRRPSGDGSVYKSPDGRWRGTVDLGWADGRRRRKYVSASTQAQALEKLRQAQRAAQVGVVSDDRITIAQFLDRWHRVNLAGTVAESTRDDYADTVRLHLEPALGRRKLSQLTVAEVDAVWAAKRKAGYKPNTIRIMRAVLRKALAQAEREGLVRRNVAALSQPARLSQPEGRSLSVEQALTLLESAKGDRLEPAYMLLLTYGLRRGELLGLAWDDFDAKERTLAVRQSLRRRKAVRSVDGERPTAVLHVELSELKTRHSRRVLYLTPGLVESLKAHAVRQRAEHAAAGSLWCDHGLIFTSTVGTPIDPDNFAKQFVRLCKGAGLGHWHPHEARHSAASVMLAQGVPLEVVSEVLGHSSIYITKDVYGHLVEGAKRDAAERMAAAFKR